MANIQMGLTGIKLRGKTQKMVRTLGNITLMT